ncbi:hypothetical protein EYS14_02305 [Alteromonadaceae bacterium M269]|nr:hypothetical protein EYS14_02305 [Alteromonadaceae bacterium M269]
MNFPAVDLGCKTSRISIQVTSDSSSSKIRKTLEKFEQHNLSKDFDHLYVYVITERLQSYSSSKLLEQSDNLPIEFDASHQILDYRDLATLLGELTNLQIEEINGHLEEEFKQTDTQLKFRHNLDAFLAISQQKIEDEKRTKKYIPSVFVETSEIKEEMRYFANPMFFYRKIDDDLGRVNLAHLNQLLNKAGIEPISSHLNDIVCLDAPKKLTELKSRFIKQSKSIKSLQEHLSPFSWYGDRAEQYTPRNNLAGYWEVFRIGIQSNGSSAFRALEALSKKIEIAQAKIFLITGMAGQGKTNFVCDIVENQFRPFQIPTIFIPARSLNDYSSPNRILSYIGNNRFAPNTSSTHELFKLLEGVANECQKPFIIAIDGINEVSDLDGFVAELRTFLEAICQYEFIKIVITCRNEFFDHKFTDVFEPQFSGHLYRVKDLRKEMTEGNKEKLLNAYLSHFEIKAKFSYNATDFLENDLILLRIFSEINEGKDIGYVSDIYKGSIFEKYLIMKINQFPGTSRQKALHTLYKICSKMMSDENFSQISIGEFDQSELHVIEQLIGEDIILRREVPTTGLASLGIENISFTYDELRDFLLAYYTVIELYQSKKQNTSSIFNKLKTWPIYEGFFRYVYVLARKHSNETILSACESSDDFHRHFLNNLSLLSADIQTPEDVERVKAILSSDAKGPDLRKVAWFLFRKRDQSEQLNINILLHYISVLDDDASEKFIRLMFSPDFHSYGGGSWKDHVTELFNDLESFSEDRIKQLDAPALAFAFHLVPYARWDTKESALNFFSKFRVIKSVSDAIERCKSSASKRVQSCLQEITEDKANL